MQLIDANKAQHGLTIVAQSQSAGKGQRGRQWVDEPGQSLLMSIIILPKQEISTQFTFNASVAVAIADALQDMDKDWPIHIKWPNDIIIGDKKAGGILIENVLRGSRWTHSVIGLGLNVKQRSFPPDLPFATSLAMATGDEINIIKLRDNIRNRILVAAPCPLPPEKIMTRYNSYLYKRNLRQTFTEGDRKFEATILNAHTDGTLEVQLDDGSIVRYQHGQVMWNWG
jgi:BirA family biotin operon repressor/biotin-[acetyl-CoA-carboxylase] ligase